MRRLLVIPAAVAAVLAIPSMVSAHDYEPIAKCIDGHPIGGFITTDYIEGMAWTVTDNGVQVSSGSIAGDQPGTHNDELNKTISKDLGDPYIVHTVRIAIDAPGESYDHDDTKQVPACQTPPATTPSTTSTTSTTTSTPPTSPPSSVTTSVGSTSVPTTSATTTTAASSTTSVPDSTTASPSTSAPSPSSTAACADGGTRAEDGTCTPVGYYETGPAPSPPDVPELPATGSSSWQLMLSASVSFAAGGLFILIARRRA